MNSRHRAQSPASAIEKVESDFLSVFPRSMIVSEDAYKRWLGVAIRKWPMDMKERMLNMRSLVDQTELANADPKIKAVARYCWRRLKEDYPEHVVEEGIYA